MKPKKLDFKKVCRICMKNSKRFISFFLNPPVVNEMELIDKMIDCLALKITIDDNLPHQICSQCLAQLNSFYKFKRKCQQSQLKFKKSRRQFGRATSSNKNSKLNLTSENVSCITSIHDCIENDDFDEKKYEKSVENETFDASTTTLDVSVCNEKSTVKNEKREEVYDCKSNGECNNLASKAMKQQENELKSVENDIEPLNFIKCSQNIKVKSKRRKVAELTAEDDDFSRKNPCICKTCGKYFSWKSNLSAHMRIHRPERPYICDQKSCQKTFKDPKSLKGHKLYVHGTVRLKCEKCDKKFGRHSTLQKHILNVHEGIRPYLCNFCGKGFSQKILLNSHLIVHTHEKKFPCEICGKSFGRKPVLEVHRRYHTGEKPFKCPVCNKNFVSKSELSRHNKFHEDKRQYGCSVCDRTFNIKRGLDEHMIIHTGDRPFKCMTCPKSYMRRRQLNSHVEKNHGVSNEPLLKVEK